MFGFVGAQMMNSSAAGRVPTKSVRVSGRETNS